jgi:signal transduction histidine kinase
MPDETVPPKLAVLEGGDAGDWAQLGAPGRSVAVSDATALVTGSQQAVTLCAEPRTALALLQSLAALGDHGAVTLLVPAAGQSEHPHLRLMRALAEGKRAWEAAFDAIVDPLLMLDTDGRVRRANMQMARALERPIEELPGQPYQDLLGPAGPSDPIASGLADGEPCTAEARFAKLADLQQVTVSPIRNSLGQLAGLVVLLKDLGPLRHEQELLQQAARLADIGQLAAGVAHEINTPLASIALRAESLLRASQDVRLQQVESFRNFPRYLETILEETFRCKRIIGALLEFSARRPPETRATDVNKLVERAADLVGHQMQLKRVALSLQLQEPLDSINADAGQLRQVLLALLMNALDATPEGGHVTVATRGAEGGVELVVEDDGAGIPPEVRDKVFTPFFTTKPLGQGTGLGLPICHGIVSSHGGRIAIDSAPGEGTRVIVTLPGARPAAEGA